MHCFPDYTVSAKTWFYLHLSGQWIDGPDLLQAREEHSVGLITDDTASHKTFIVVTGGTGGSPIRTLDSVEILDIEGTAWILGKLS